MAKEGTRSKPIKMEVRLSESVFASTPDTIEHIYKSIKPKLKKVKGGDYTRIVIKRQEEVDGRKLVTEGSLTVKRGRRKLSNKVASQIAKQLTAELNEKYNIYGTPEVFEEDLDEFIPERRFHPGIEFEPTPEKKKRAKVKPLPIKKDKQGRYHDARGRYIKGRPRRDSAGRWRDSAGRFIKIKSGR